MSNIDLDLKSKVPIYIQIRDQLRLLIATGELKQGDQMPPVRDLAGDLLINPNTVSKAYQDLEREGYIHTRRGMGTFVTERTADEGEPVDQAHAEQMTREFVTRMSALGMNSAEIRKILDDVLKT